MTQPQDFTWDTTERASKGALYAFASYWFESWLGTLVHLTMTERAGVFAVANLVCSVAGSLLSKRVVVTSRWPFVRRSRARTASLVPALEYKR